jgi:hypothetical protein
MLYFQIYPHLFLFSNKSRKTDHQNELIFELIWNLIYPIWEGNCACLWSGLVCSGGSEGVKDVNFIFMELSLWIKKVKFYLLGMVQNIKNKKGLTLSFTLMHMCIITLSTNIFLDKRQKVLHFFCIEKHVSYLPILFHVNYNIHDKIKD